MAVFRVQCFQFYHWQQQYAQQQQYYKNIYEKTNIITINEKIFYKQLKQITDKHELQIFVKVRLADIVKVKKNVNKRDFQVAFNKIQSKHIDFIVADQNTLNIICAIELDDNSHNYYQAQKNDTFKNELLSNINLPLIRTKNIQSVEQKIISYI